MYKIVVKKDAQPCLLFFLLLFLQRIYETIWNGILLIWYNYLLFSHTLQVVEVEESVKRNMT